MTINWVHVFLNEIGIKSYISGNIWWVATNDKCVLKSLRWAINRLAWPFPAPAFPVCYDVFKQQYTSCVKVGNGWKLGLYLGREYSKKLFGTIFHSRCNCPLKLYRQSYVYIFQLSDTGFAKTKVVARIHKHPIHLTSAIVLGMKSL